MTTYAQLPSGIIAPHDLALQAMSDFLFSRGGYRSASGTSKNTAGWSVSAGSADMDTIPDLPTLRAQSSDLVRNDPLATGAILSPIEAGGKIYLKPRNKKTIYARPAGKELCRVR